MMPYKNKEDKNAHNRRYKSTEEYRLTRIQQTIERRLKAIEGYGGKCVCCEDSRTKYLQLDHVNNDGAEHRRGITSTRDMYSWAIRNQFPDTLQLMCANCHFAKSYYGNCSEEEHNLSH